MNRVMFCMNTEPKIVFVYTTHPTEWMHLKRHKVDFMLNPLLDTHTHIHIEHIRTIDRTNKMYLPQCNEHSNWIDMGF